MTVFVTRASNYEKIVEKVGHEPEDICLVNDIYYLYQSKNEDKEKILEVTTEVEFGDIEFENLINSAYEYYKPALILSRIQTPLYYLQNPFILENLISHYKNTLRKNLELCNKYRFPLIESQNMPYFRTMNDPTDFSKGNFYIIMDYDEENNKLCTIDYESHSSYERIYHYSLFKISRDELIKIFSSFPDEIRLSKIRKEILKYVS
jgi:hypothetical protein